MMLKFCNFAGLDLNISEQKIKSEPLVEKALSTQIGSSNSRATTMKIGQGEEKVLHYSNNLLNEYIYPI